jgi:hypothetical protein
VTEATGESDRAKTVSRYARPVTETRMTSAVRRATRAATFAAGTGLIASSVLLAGPADAGVPEGWSNPEEVDNLHALLLLGGVPLLLFVLIALAVYLPSFARSVATPEPGAGNEWIGGPRRTVDELAGPDSEASKAGGASGRW